MKLCLFARFSCVPTSAGAEIQGLCPDIFLIMVVRVTSHTIAYVKGYKPEYSTFTQLLLPRLGNPFIFAYICHTQKI